MNVKKLAPWNWFKDEQTQSATANWPVATHDTVFPLVTQMQREMDRLFDTMLRTFGMPSAPLSDWTPAVTTEQFFRPQVDISGSDKEYLIQVEVPGVDEDDVKLELDGRRLVIRGEKLREHKEDAENVYRIERSYGAFERVLTLPEDADAENIEAVFKNGVLSIHLPRKAASQSSGKVIEIKKAS
jgi:HSP20 family protein